MRNKIAIWGGGQIMTVAMLEMFEVFRIKNMADFSEKEYHLSKNNHSSNY